jgi:hypothetical protein
MSILENSKKGGENSRFDYNFKTLLGLQKIADNTQGISELKTPTSVITDGTELPTPYEVTIPAGASEISIFNNGTGDATVNGVKCPPGVTRNFGMRNPISAVIVCNGGGTEELIIDYML